MNQFVSLLGGQAGPAANEHNFSAANVRGKTATPFSSLLERATYQAPERNSLNAKAARSRSARADESQDESVRPERRAPVREKNKREKTTEDQSLAGACAVNGQPIKAETPVQTGGPATEVISDETPQAALTKSAEADVVTETEIAATVPVDGETVVATSLLEGVGTSLSGEDLATTLTPANVAKTEQKVATPAATPVVEQLPTPLIPVEHDLVGAVAASESSPGELVDLPVATTAASAREAEVLLTTSLEKEASLSAPAVIEDVVVASVAPEEARRAVRAAQSSWAETLEKARGIGGAKSSETMKTAIKKEEVAGVAQQILPGQAPVTVSTLPTLPGETRRGSIGAVASVESLHLTGKITPASDQSDVAGAENKTELRATSPLVRVSELISREVRMFKRAGDDLVEVVLTPDTKTQISLRLQWREGQVEVQARCDFGDFQSLNQQWPQLQVSLANQGVRLSHLSERAPTGFTEFFNNPNFSQQKGGDRQPAPTTGAEPSTPSVGSPAKSAPAQPVRGNRRLESWA